MTTYLVRNMDAFKAVLVRIGPTLTAQVGYDPSFMPSNGNRPGISIWPAEALVDTGGSVVTCVDVRLADALNLPVAGQSEDAASVLGVGRVVDYYATIHTRESS